MRQAIATRYLGPTDYRGARIKAQAQAGSVILHWDDSLDTDENHDKAAIALCKKLGWTGKLAAGGLPPGSGNCYVFVGKTINVK